MRYLLLLVLLTSCSGPGPSRGDGVIYYRSQGVWLDEIMAEAETMLPYGVRLEASDRREDLKVSIAPDGYFRGCAHTCSNSGWVTLNLDTPERFREKALYAVLHEVGHMIGSEHREGPYIMNTGVLYLLDEELSWHPQSLEEIEGCQGLGFMNDKRSYGAKRRAVASVSYLQASDGNR